ncbi:MAG: S8 family serine peptidase [Candidatus Helarchaeota archaeon]|nr:S8 family serine peptidase [Candidatus Helarchaeota archaeon]
MKRKNLIFIFIILILVFSFFIGVIAKSPNEANLGLPNQKNSISNHIPIQPVLLDNLNNIGDRSYISSIAKNNGNNIIIAILDTGIDVNHPDLDDLDDNNNTNDPKVIGGVSFAEGEPIYFGDIHGHGTYIAGIIAGTGNASTGYIGIAPKAMLLNVKVLSSYEQNGTFYTKTSWILSGIEWSINHGADIIVMAWSIPGSPNDQINNAINEAVKRGIIVVTASGDDGPEFSSIESPGMSSESITVGIYNNLTNTVAEISSRGPTFDFRPGIDIVASGINITSTRAKNSSFGLEVNDNYTIFNGSAASAAYVAGVAAIFLRTFKFLNPWALKIALIRTAIDLNLNPNIQGAGLLNETAAFIYLNDTLFNPLNENRTYSPSLPYAGFIGTENKSLFLKDFSSNCSFGSYGDSIILTEYTNSTDFNASHVLGGIFAVQYNNGNVTWLSDFDVLRETHYVSLGIYDRLVSVLSDDNLIIIILIEAWEWANISRSGSPSWEFGNLTSYRIRFIFENIGTEDITDLFLFSWWKMDLFLNETDTYDEDDQGQYQIADNLFYAWDNDNVTISNVSYIGFKPNTSALQMWYEVNSSENTYNFIEDDEIQNRSNSFTGDVGFAMKWKLSNIIGTNEKTEFVGSIGIGKSLDDLKNRTSWIFTNVSESYNITDICVARKNHSLTRMLDENEVLQSNIIVINVGSTTINHGKVKFEANSTDEGVRQIFNLSSNFEPFDFDNSISVLWDPIDGGFFNVSWFGVNATISELDQIQQNLNYNDTTQDFQLTDNLLQRNTFVLNSTFLNNVTPLLIPNNTLPFFPFMMNHSGDISIFNLTILSAMNFSTIAYEINGNISDWIDIEYQISSSYFGSIFLSITLNTSFLSLPGYYKGYINISIDIFKTIFLINASFNLSFPKGRILFDLSHTSISSLSDWPERMDSIHSSYFNLYRNISSAGYKIDELAISELTYEILKYYDCLIICDPEKNFSNEEIIDIQNYVNSGGSLFLWVETPDECANSSINLLLNGTFDIEMEDTIYPNNSVIINHSVPNYSFTENIYSIEMVSPVNLSISTSSIDAQNLTDYIVYWQVNNRGKIIVIGDSQIFNNDHLGKQNNSQFAINCLNWLINETINITLTITPEIKYLGDIICFTVNLTAPNGTAVATDIAFAAFILPNGSLFYMPMFWVREGYHTTFFHTGFIKQNGTYEIYIYIDHVSGVLLYYNSTFNVTTGRPSVTPPLLWPILILIKFPEHPLYLSIIWAILGIIISIWAISAIKFKRKVKKTKIESEK